MCLLWLKRNSSVFVDRKLLHGEKWWTKNTDIIGQQQHAFSQTTKAIYFPASYVSSASCNVHSRFRVRTQQCNYFGILFVLTLESYVCVCVCVGRRVFVYLQFAKLLAIIVRKSKFKVWDLFLVLFDPLDTSVHFFVSINIICWMKRFWVVIPLRCLRCHHTSMTQD